MFLISGIIYSKMKSIFSYFCGIFLFDIKMYKIYLIMYAFILFYFIFIEMLY
jgi:hypothetical protein